ncbi:MAG: hypothetical protein AAF702_05105 [Chloroflexota bacterium]
MFEYDMETGSISKLYQGHTPTVMSDADTVFFFRNAKHRLQLFRSSLADRETVDVFEPLTSMWATNDLAVVSAVFGKPYVIPVGEHQIVFTDSTGNLLKYNISKDQVETLNTLGCIPFTFREKTRELLCSDVNYGVVLSINLNDFNTRTIQKLHGTSGHVYAPKVDAVLFAVTHLNSQTGEKKSIYSYKFETGESELVAPFANLHSGIIMQRN